METELIKEAFVGKKILSIISLNIDEESIKQELNKICNNDYSDIVDAQLILFNNNEAIVFVDFDCDGYRSGNWNLIKLKSVLDKGKTNGIKNINSKVLDIEYFSDKKVPNEYSDSDGVMITTEDYVISMGQDNSDSYYPSNFFNIEECKSFALGEAILLK